MNSYNDDDFRELVDQVAEGYELTTVSDSCHSGGLISGAKEQLRESMMQNGFGFGKFLLKIVEDAIESRGIRIPPELGVGRHHGHEEEGYQGPDHYIKNIFLQLPTLVKHKTGEQDIDVGKLRLTLFDVFGEDASPKVKKFMKFILNKLHRRRRGQGEGGGLLGMVGNLALQFLQQKLQEHDGGCANLALQTHVGGKQEVYAGTTESGLPDNGILVGGCQTDQTSADATPPGDSSRSYGALSNAIQIIMIGSESGDKISNKELVIGARQILKEQGFTQRPGLYCSDDHVHAPFIC